jgi:ribonuclease HI
MPTRVKIYFDGGYRPGGMETAVVLRGQAFVRPDRGPGSSIEAEWLALIDALRIAHDHGLTDAVLLGDCVPVIEQANGRAPCRRDGIPLFAAFRALAGDHVPRIRYIRRTQNLAGIALARRHAR